MGAPTSSAGNSLEGRPDGVKAAAPMTSTASSATALWYSLQYSLKVDAAGPGSAPARNLVSVRIPR